MTNYLKNDSKNQELEFLHEASVYVINSGSTKDTFMQNCLRELCYIEAIYQFKIKAKHIAGEENRLEK
jgi:hypothetical protein